MMLAVMGYIKPTSHYRDEGKVSAPSIFPKSEPGLVTIRCYHHVPIYLPSSTTSQDITQTSLSVLENFNSRTTASPRMMGCSTT